MVAALASKASGPRMQAMRTKRPTFQAHEDFEVGCIGAVPPWFRLAWLIAILRALICTALRLVVATEFLTVRQEKKCTRIYGRCIKLHHSLIVGVRAYRAVYLVLRSVREAAGIAGVLPPLAVRRTKGE